MTRFDPEIEDAMLVLANAVTVHSDDDIFAVARMRIREAVEELLRVEHGERSEDNAD